MEEKESKSVFLSKEERLALGQRTPRQEIKCPVCGKKAERERNGVWKCIDSKKLSPLWSELTCGATGVSLGEDLIVVGKRVDANRSVQESN